MGVPKVTVSDWLCSETNEIQNEAIWDSVTALISLCRMHIKQFRWANARGGNMTNETKNRKRRSVLWYVGLLAALVCLAISTVQAADVTITVKGTVALDSPDDYGIFQVGKDLKGQPFTLTITFDDSKSVVRVTNGSSVSEISQTSGSSPARVVLKIGPGSYVFGTKPESKWSAYKSTDPKSGCCGGIGFHVMEGIYPQTSLLWLKLEPAIGGKPLYGSVEWQTPISSARLDGDPMASQFRITRPGDHLRVTRGRLMPQSMTEGPGNGADSAQINDAPAKNGEQAAIVDPSGGSSGTSTKGAGRSKETRAGDGIIITVKGKVSIGHDDYGIFKVGRDLTGQGFTLVFTFSEAANHHHHMCGDQADGTSYFGSAKDVSAKAVLTIGNGSFVFGAQPDRSWGAFRGIPSECMVDEIAMNVKEGVYPQTTLLWVKLQPPPGGKPLNNQHRLELAAFEFEPRQQPASFELWHQPSERL